ncbi:MAG: type II toxin-antitoxin system VapC family toxin [Candidatus Kapabacteria bacterium]|nr:type II toxin-antitoxin system VapC family toxin [Candidatus Kapabacteria bacterium]
MTKTPQRAVLDSSCWIEYFLGSAAAKPYASIVAKATIIVPSITIFEVSRDLLRRFDSENTLRAVSLMQQHNVVPLTADVALNAAQLAVNLNLSSADAIVCATAWQHKATLYTHDVDLNGLDNVVYLSRS